MYKLFFKIWLTMVVFSTLSYGTQKPSLLIYCGTTIIKPIKEMAQIFKKKYNCEIKISQGGSQELYDAIDSNKKGDLFFPTSGHYITKNLDSGYFVKDTIKLIGFNQIAIFVQKENPKNIKSIDSLMDKDIKIVMGDPESGSIGKATYKLLIKERDEEFFDEAFERSEEIGTDSRNLNRWMEDKTADMTINWRPTGAWPENNKYIDIVEINSKYAPKKKLFASLLKFSKYPELSKKFIKFASSKEGQNIVKKYGFMW